MIATVGDTVYDWPFSSRPSFRNLRDDLTK